MNKNWIKFNDFSTSFNTSINYISDENEDYISDENSNYVINNNNSLYGGFLIEELPIVPIAEEKVDFIEIDGRDGYLTLSQDALKPIDYEVEIIVKKRSDIQKIRNNFRGNGKLILSHDKNKFYYARVIGVTSFEREVMEVYRCIIYFKLQPYAYEITNNEITITNSSGYVFTNNTNTSCEPIITLYGSGNCVLVIGNKQINITDIDDSITLDFGMQEAYKKINGSKENMNTHVNGYFPIIESGDTIISWNGSGISSIKILPNFRWR